MITINEYLLGKKNNKLYNDKYYVILPKNKPFLEFKKMYNDEAIKRYPLEYWIMTAKQIFTVLDKFHHNDLGSFNLSIWEVPDTYDIDEFKQHFIDGEIDPFKELNEITVDDLI